MLTEPKERREAKDMRFDSSWLDWWFAGPCGAWSSAASSFTEVEEEDFIRSSEGTGWHGSSVSRLLFIVFVFADVFALDDENDRGDTASLPVVAKSWL